ncbi:MAG: NUDIX hydrolase [Bacteroidota bacterium]
MNWTKISEKIAYQGWRGIVQKTFKLPNGKRVAFDIIQSSEFVTIAAFTKKKEAILVKQFRPGPEVILTSFPEGGIEKGEDPKIAAARELLEETGYQAGKIVFLKKFRHSYSTEKQICFLALDCEKVSTQQLDHTEFIDVFLLPVEKFKTYLTDSSDESFTNVEAGYLALAKMGLL